MKVSIVDQPSTVEEALAVLASGSSARVVAGGTALVPSLRQAPLPAESRLVWVGGIERLRGIDIAADVVRLGAATVLAQVEDDRAVCDRLPGLADCLAAIATPRIRFMATVGGALAQGDAGYDLPVLLYALGARVSVRGPIGTSVVPVGSLTADAATTDVGSRSIITDVTIPVVASRRAAFLKLSPRTGTDRAVASVAVCLDVDDGEIQAARIALGGLGRHVLVAVEAAGLLVGGRLGHLGERAAAVQDAVRTAMDAAGPPPADVRASAQYRRAVAPVLARRCVLRAETS